MTYDVEDTREHGAYEVQAWFCSGDSFAGYVYDVRFAHQKLEQGCTVQQVWLPRDHKPDFGTWREVKPNE